MLVKPINYYNIKVNRSYINYQPTGIFINILRPDGFRYTITFFDDEVSFSKWDIKDINFEVASTYNKIL